MSKEHGINDKLVMLIGIPLIAIIFPNATGLIINSRYSLPLLFVQYGYFIFTVYLIWRGNILVILYVKKKIDFDNSDYHKYVLAILISTIVYSGIVAGCLLMLWTIFFEENHASWRTLTDTILILIFASVFITTIYENYVLNKKKLSALSKAEQMSLAKTQAELTMLKNQLDPHFIFNSLNTLSYLISSNTTNAKLYNDTL